MTTFHLILCMQVTWNQEASASMRVAAWWRWWTYPALVRATLWLQLKHHFLHLPFLNRLSLKASVNGKLNSKEFVHLWNKVMKYKVGEPRKGWVRSAWIYGYKIVPVSVHQEVFFEMDVSQTGTLSLSELRNAVKASGKSLQEGKYGVS